MNSHPFGFRIVGPTSGERRLVDAAAAFNAYAACDERAKVEAEAYLSAFQFGNDFAEHLRRSGSVKGYSGSCWAAWLWWDIDRPGDLERARIDSGRLGAAIVERFGVNPDDVLVFYSGAKGFHVGLGTACIVGGEPSPVFHRIARRFAENLAAVAGVAIDPAVYDQVRAFRAPNSRHPKTGLFKRRFAVEAIQRISAAALVDLAKEPDPFEIPDASASRCDWNPSADWHAATEQVQSEAEATAQRRAAVASGIAGQTLNRLTLDFIRDGAEAGDRHRLLYSAARNLAEFRCPAALAHALLTDAGRDSGLAPAEVRRQIECGLKDTLPGTLQNLTSIEDGTPAAGESAGAA